MDSNDIPETKKLRKGQDRETSQAEGVVNGKPVDFPEEVLEMIFSHLSDPKDLTAVSNASPQFNRILKPTQQSWAFKMVLPLIFSGLDKEDILNCRLVSKEWNKSVDNFLQTQPRDRTWTVYPRRKSEVIEGHGDAFGRNHPPHRPQYETYLYSKDFRMILRDSDDIETFMKEMKPHPRNPFVLRDVCFDNYDEGEDYWIAVLAFLSKLGQHIWHVHLAPNLNEHQRYHLAHNYSILQRALSLMPNLRTLSLHGFDRDPLGYEADRRMVNSVKKYVRAHPLPELPHLHTLSEILPEGPNPVMAALLGKYAGQLTKLDSRPYVWFKNPPHFHGLPLSEMRDLHLNFNLCYCSWRNVCRSLVAPNLAKLHLIIWDDWEIGKLLRPLKEGFPSLVYLGLGLRARCKNFKSSAPPEFGLERIKTVEIDDSPFIQYDHIFNHLPGLEYVLVCHSKHLSRIREVNENVEEEAEEEEEEESEDEDCGTSSDEEMPEFEMVENRDVGQLEIRRLMLSGRMYESDIWNRLKFLKEFTVARMCDNGDTENDIETTEQYTRDAFNQKLEQQK